MTIHRLPNVVSEQFVNDFARKSNISELVLGNNEQLVECVSFLPPSSDSDHSSVKMPFWMFFYSVL